MTEGSTSGYSSAKTSPQPSDEDLLKSFPSHKVRRRIRLRESAYDSGVSEDEEEEDDEEECEFRPVVIENEMEPHKEWYHKLLQLRSESSRSERNVFPPFPPAPLPSKMLAASRAQLVNPFEEVKRAAAVSSSVNSPTSTSPNAINRFCPTDFRALPPPHIFLEIIKTLAPHQYVDLTYALAGAVLLDIGAKVPDHFPPLPPKIEPFRVIDEEESVSLQETEVSSQSSSGGEYSDASEETRMFLRLKREKNHRRRAERKIRIVARQKFLEKYKEVESECDKEKAETFPRDQNYKSTTLSKFIMSVANRPPPLIPSPLLPQFLPFLPILPPLLDVANFQEAYLPPLPPLPPLPFFSIGILPFPFQPPPIPPATLSFSTPSVPKTHLKPKSPVKNDVKKILLSKNETAMNTSLRRWRRRID